MRRQVKWCVEGGSGKVRKTEERRAKTVVRRQNTERREEGNAEGRWEGAGGGRKKVSSRQSAEGSRAGAELRVES